MIEHAPETYGVYGLFDIEQLIYIGKADNGMYLRWCLLLHQDGALGGCTMRANAYAWEINMWPAAREAELLAAYFKLHKAHPRCQAAA